jgi:hypothetical protein
MMVAYRGAASGVASKEISWFPKEAADIIPAALPEKGSLGSTASLETFDKSS